MKELGREKRSDTSRERKFSNALWLDRFTLIFVRGIRRDSQKKELREIFSKLGRIVNIYILRKNGEIRRFAFVRLKTYEEVEGLLKRNPKIRIGASCGTESCSRSLPSNKRKPIQADKG